MRKRWGTTKQTETGQSQLVFQIRPDDRGSRARKRCRRGRPRMTRTRGINRGGINSGYGASARCTIYVAHVVNCGTYGTRVSQLDGLLHIDTIGCTVVPRALLSLSHR